MRLGRGCFAIAVVSAFAANAQESPDAGEPVDAGVPLVAVAPIVQSVQTPTEPPPRVQVQEYADSAYHFDNGNIAAPGSLQYDPTGSNYVDWLNRLQLDASWKQLTAQVRIDSALFGHAPVAAPGDVRLQQLLLNRYGSRIDLEKASLTYSSRFLDVTLGDTYVTYGRGLVLALRKVDEFGIDTTARGLSATLHAWGFTLHALGGFSNIINVDLATGRTAENPNDTILGARAEYKFGRWFTLGADAAHVIYAQNLQTAVPQNTQDQVTSFSGTVELPRLGPYGTFYAELAAQHRLTNGQSLWTWALYSTASIFLGRVTLLLEYKDYRHYSGVPTSLDPTLFPEFALSDFYTAPPTLERVTQLVLNNTDVAGGHLRASFRASENVVPFASMAVFVDRRYQTQIYDPYVGAELRWNDGQSRASLSGGWRLNQYGAGSSAPGSVFQGAAHGEYDVTQHLTGPYSLELSGLHVSHRDAQGPKYLDWHEGQAYLSFKRAALFSAAIGFEYYTEAAQTIRSWYFNASGTWNVMDGLLLRLFVGGQRAGIKCVNGVCRNYPAFDGARLEVVAKY